ncbi:MAG: tetratricopeptide repeat protein [Curvibacter sp.]|nr:tetratricopeptide repeat protein [Curvibacter sp.]
MPSPAPIEQALATLLRLSNSGSPQQALALGLALLEQAPGHAALHQLLAHLFLGQGQLGPARAHIATSLRLRPEHLPSRLLAARLARQAGQPEQALIELEAARALAPTDAELTRQLADACLEAGQPARAEALLRTLLEGPAGASAALGYELGRALRAQDRLDEAAQAFAGAVKADPALVPAWFALALVRQDLGQIDAAVAALGALLALDPAHDQAWLNLGLLQQAQGRCDEALSSYAQAHALQPASFGRIAHALCSQPHGRIWLQLDELRQLLQGLRA